MRPVSKWQNRRPPAPPTSALHNNNLPTFHGQMCFHGSLGIQVEDCEIPVEPKPKEGPFKKAVSPMPTWQVLAIDSKIAPIPHELIYSPGWPWFCH